MSSIFSPMLPFGGSMFTGRGLAESTSLPASSVGSRKIVSYVEERAVKLGIAESGVPLLAEQLVELHQHALDTKDVRLQHESELHMELAGLALAEGDAFCAHCGGVTCDGKGLGETTFTYAPLLEANPWHDPATGQFGRPDKALASTKFAKKLDVGSFKWGVNSADRRATPLGKTKKVRGQPCGCAKLNANGKGCAVKHKEICRELAWGARGKEVLKAKVQAAHANKMKKLDDFKKSQSGERGKEIKAKIRARNKAA